MVYDPGTKKLTTLVYTYRNQLFKGPNDLDFDAEGNLFFTDPWGTGPGPTKADETGAVYQYSRDGVLRKLLDHRRLPERRRRLAGRRHAGHRRLRGRADHLRARSLNGPTRPRAPNAPAIRST